MAAVGNRGGLSAWRWIFVIEGLFVSEQYTSEFKAVLNRFQTMSVGVAVFFILPNNIVVADFLSEDERAVALKRLRGIEHGTGEREM
jgi:hypothetical protein